MTFEEYAAEWIDRYTGRRGLRESTRENYRSDLRRYGIPYLGRKRMTDIKVRDLAQLVNWLCDDAAITRHLNQQREDRGVAPLTKPRSLSDTTIAHVFKPVKACLATATLEGVIRFNPARDVAMPHRQEDFDDEDLEGDKDAKALTREQLARFLATIDPRYRLLFEFLAATGLRISEANGLEWRHVETEGNAPHVKVRRQLYRGRVGPPKSKKGVRDVPLSDSLAKALSAHRERLEAEDHEPVFMGRGRVPVNAHSVRVRVLRPAADELGLHWLKYRSFRHTAASFLFEREPNAVAVSRFLGHASPAITLDTYLHLIRDTPPPPIDLSVEIALEAKRGDKEVAMRAVSSGDVDTALPGLEVAK